MKDAFIFGLVFLLAGCGFTKMTHPEVEVLDPDSRKFVIQYVSVVSQCGSCHERLSDKYAVYSKVVKNKTSLDKLGFVRSDAFRGAELSGYDNYAESDWGFYYFYPWWYDNYVLSLGFFGGIPIDDSEAAITGEGRRRHSYRRSSGRLRLSSPVAPTATVTVPATPVAPSAPATSTANPNRVTNSTELNGTSQRRTPEHHSTPEPIGREGDGRATPAPPEKRESGRMR